MYKTPSKTTTNKKDFIAESNVDVALTCVNKSNVFCFFLLVNDCLNQDISLKIKLTSVWSLCLITLCLLTTSITFVYDALSDLNSSGTELSMFHLYF